MGCFRIMLVLQAATHPFPPRVNRRGFVSWLTVATGTAASWLWGWGFLSHKAFLIGHDRSFWLPDLIYTSPQNICCSLHRVLSYALLKVVAVSTRGSQGSVTTNKGKKQINATPENVSVCLIWREHRVIAPHHRTNAWLERLGLLCRHFLFSLHVLLHLMLPLCSAIQLLMRLVFNNSKESNICKKLRKFGSISSIRISTQTLKLDGRNVLHPVSCRANIWNIIVLWAKSSKLCSILASLMI